MGSPSENDSEVFIAQARWLLEWHDRRSEAFITRAVALLGFDGVVLTLLIQGAALHGIKASAWTWGFLTISLLALLGSALFALLAIAPQEVAVPHVQQLRSWWGEHAGEPYPGSTAPRIAESLLNSAQISGDSAVSTIKGAADNRATRFKASLWFMFCAFVFLSCLFLNVLTHTWKK